MRKEKCLAVYEPPTQGATYFLNWVSQIIDFHSIRYEKQVIIENFNLTPDNELIFQKNQLKSPIYRNCTSFSKDSFLIDLSNSIENSQRYEAFETKTVEVLDKHAPQKTKLRRGNHKPNLSKRLRKEIMKRSQLKSIANKTGKDIDLYNFRKQRNLVVTHNKKQKKICLNSLAIENDSKLFWETCKPYFFNK